MADRPKRIVASLVECPSRMTWELRDDGLWWCTCRPGCPERASYVDLIDPQEASR